MHCCFQWRSKAEEWRDMMLQFTAAKSTDQEPIRPTDRGVLRSPLLLLPIGLVRKHTNRKRKFSIPHGRHKPGAQEVGRARKMRIHGHAWVHTP